MNRPWAAIFERYNIGKHSFKKAPFYISAEEIKQVSRHMDSTTEREVRVLCKQDSREDRPEVFKDKGLFILPVRNGHYCIIQGEGYIDLPQTTSQISTYKSKLTFELETSRIGDSEMQHLDFAYATSLIRTFMNDDSLVLTIRGRKYTPEFSFRVGKHEIESRGVQTEVDAGFEGKDQIVLIEAKNKRSTNTIIRQLFYPYRQWQSISNKKVKTLFFERTEDYYTIMQFEFSDPNDYNSINLTKSQSFIIE